MLLFTNCSEDIKTSLFLIFTFLLFIFFATKALRHKETRRLFFIQKIIFIAPLCLQERGRGWGFFSWENDNFISEKTTFTFNILHFFLATKTQSHKEPRRFFYIRNENFPLWGIEGAHEFTNYFSWENDNFISEKTTFTFNILHSIFYIFFSPQRHKVTKNHEGFFYSEDNFYWSPLPPGEGSGVRFFFMRKWYFHFRKNHFYIQYFTFNILHFILATKALRHKESRRLFLNFYFWILIFLTTNSRIFSSPRRH